MKKVFLIFFAFVGMWPLVSRAAPTSVSPSSLPNWYGSSSSHTDATTGGNTELSSEAITAAVSGATTSGSISATIPATTTAGDYTIRIRIHDATTEQYFTRALETITVY